MRNLIIFIVFLLLAIISYFLISDIEIFSANKKELKEFAIEDTAAVDMIFISKLDGKNVTLSRRDSKKWQVNGEIEARPDAINLILKTLHDIKVQQNVSQKGVPRVLKRMATSGTKVEIYMGKDRAEKVWYIGDPTASRVGTYMLLEEDGKKSSKPYVTHMLMERGYLGTRFFAEQSLWRDRVFLKTNPKEIKSIEVVHKNDSLTSFKINKLDTIAFTIQNLKTSEKFNLNSNKGIEYFKLFKGVYYEYLDIKTQKKELDSIYNSKARHHVTLELSDGKRIILKTFNLPVPEGSKLGDKVIDYNPERMYAFSSVMANEYHPIVQNLTFDPLVPGFKAFASSTNVEK